MTDRDERQKGFQGRAWQYSYKTSSAGAGGRLVDILHDFYIPALGLSVRYERVAGYFRSTSLAAASQGFSAFTRAGGKMRLIAGADLAGEDVEAILTGDAKRMADRLNEQLTEPETWPDDVTRGMELLSWMVARGRLDIRVAFRIHKETGKPIPFTQADDGYVHEKWALFTDALGNRIYIAGSLNESYTALVVNAENIDVHPDWWGDIERKRADDAQAAFEVMWNDRNPHMRVLTLPEAVKQKLVRIGKSVKLPVEVDGSTAHRPEVAPPSPMERLRFALIKDGPRLPGGRFVGMETAPVEPWPHQVVVARRLIETWPYSFLLCDEVGLGKTIEAGLAIRSLYLCGLVKRVLIAPPAGLTRQWHREMAAKFFLPFARALSGTPVRHEHIFPFEETRLATGLYGPDLSLVSTGLLTRKDRQTDLQAAEPFDIAVVDEAHNARRKNSRTGARAEPRFGNLYLRVRDDLKKRCQCLWMATATPMQLDWIEAFDLLHLTDRVGPFQSDPYLTWAYYEALGSLARGRQIAESQWEFLRKAISKLRFHDPFLWLYINEAVIDGRIRMTTSQWLEKGIVPKGVDRKNIQRLLFSAAPLSRVMLRHTRPLLEIYREKGQLGANLAERIILPVPRIIMTTLEKKAYDELESYCTDLTSQIASHAGGKVLPSSLGFLLSFLRLRFASSLFAIRETLRRRRDRVNATLERLLDIEDAEADIDDLEELIAEDEEEDDRIFKTLLKDRTPQDLERERDRLKAMLLTLYDLSGTPSKMKQLLRVLDKRRVARGRIQQTVIFTRFYDTLQDIVDRLRQIDPSMLIGTYSGRGGQYIDPHRKQLRGVDREEIKRRYLRGEIDVLICTDAAAEGLNLQTADLLINYDLPWNPMKVEQRIGRIDRIGQKHDRIYVLNLCYVDSAEQIVYDRLLKRLAQAGDIVGLQQVSMLPVLMEEFSELAAGTLKPEALEARARERIADQRQRAQSMEIPAHDLYDIYFRLSEKQGRKPAPVTLEWIWQAISGSKYLRDAGCTLSTDNAQKILTLRGLDSVPEGTCLTIDRLLYDQGGSGLEGRLHFASYGDPFFEALMDEFQRHPLPDCVLRLTEHVPGTNAEVVAYAASCLSEGGLPEIRLITSYQDLEELQLDEAARLSESELTGLKQNLHDIIRREFDPTRAVGRLKKQNQRAARAQVIIGLMTISSLLQPITSTDEDNFSTTVKDLDNLVAERDRLMVTRLQVDPLKMIAGELLFDLQIPKVGETTTLTLPIILVGSAVDAGCRIADAIKVKKSDLTLGMVRSRIDREIERQLKNL